MFLSFLSFFFYFSLVQIFNSPDVKCSEVSVLGVRLLERFHGDSGFPSIFLRFRPSVSPPITSSVLIFCHSLFIL